MAFGILCAGTPYFLHAGEGPHSEGRSLMRFILTFRIPVEKGNAWTRQGQPEDLQKASSAIQQAVQKYPARAREATERELPRKRPAD